MISFFSIVFVFFSIEILLSEPIPELSKEPQVIDEYLIPVKNGVNPVSFLELTNNLCLYFYTVFILSLF